MGDGHVLSSRLAKISKSPELQLLCDTGGATLLCTTQLEPATDTVVTPYGVAPVPCPKPPF